VLFEHLDPSVGLSRLRAEAVDGELGGLAGPDLDVQIVIVLLEARLSSTGP